jgi:hypothetical protein
MDAGACTFAADCFSGFLKSGGLSAFVLVGSHLVLSNTKAESI